MLSYVLSNAYRRNLLYQQLNFKWQSWLHLRALVNRLHSRPCGRLRKFLFTSGFCVVLSLDVLLGCLTLLAIQRYGVRERLQVATTTYTLYMLHATENLVQWVMGVPGGLKLNTPLAQFVGNRCLAILQFWEYFYIDFISTYLSLILSSILLLSPLGVTVALTALHDFLKFLNLFVICFFIFAQRLFTIQLSALKSLARLFMGKKWNVLRRRVDSCDYDTFQLLLGTLLFTILLFLLPTTGVYCVIFLLLRLVQFSLQLVLRLAAVAVNNLTVSGWEVLRCCLSDAPITSLRLSLEPCRSQRAGEKAKAKAKVETEGRVDDWRRPTNVRLQWGGRSLSVAEAATALESYSEVELVQAVLGGTEEGFQHSMLDWIGVLPL